MKKIILLGLTIALASASAFAAAPDKPPQARIPFANSGSISDWQPDGDKALYLRGIGKQWYHAELLGFCRDLPYANAIGFETRGTGDFDSFSTIIVRGQRCPLTSLVKSDPPPKKVKKKK